MTQNINISGNVGNFNLGQQYGAVTNTINQLASNGGPKQELATALKAVSEGINTDKVLSEEQKSELLEGISTLAEQGSAEAPKAFTVKSVLKYLPDALRLSASLDTLWSAHSPAIIGFFHHLTV